MIRNASSRTRVSINVGFALSAARLGDIGLHRVENLRVTGTATEVAGQRLPDRLPIRPGMAFEKCNRGEEHAGRAESALDGPVIQEGLLEWMEVVVVLEAPESQHRARAEGWHQDEAARHRAPVQKYGARATDALVAAFLGVEVPQNVAQGLEQGLMRRRLDLTWPPIEEEVHDHGVASARSTARPSARPPRTSTRSERYDEEAKASSWVGTDARAVAAARAIRSGVGS